MKINHTLLTVILTALITLPVSGFAETSGCIKCHESSKSPELKNLHSQWEASIHARSKISCEECHAGNPKEADKKKAHQGVYNSMDPKSTVYYTKIPDLCGQCHGHELDYFKSSRHYMDLMDKGVGPNCITCHDAMLTKVIGADEIEVLCSVCHNARNKNLPHIGALAKNLLDQMAAITLKISQAEKAIAKAVEQGLNTDRAQGFLNLSRREFEVVKEGWHNFRVQRTSVLFQGVDNLIQKSLDAIDTGEK